MAEKREVFTPLEDAGGEGIAYVGKVPGGAQSTDEQAPVLPAIDAANDLQNIEIRDPGDSATGVSGQPSFAFQDSSGNFVYPTLNSNGELVVSQEAGTPASNSDVATLAALNTEQDVVDLTVAVDDVVKIKMMMGSAFQPMIFILYHDDNTVLNELARFVTGPGDFNHSGVIQSIQFTAGAAGTQRVVLRATQLRGSLTDAHGTISIQNLG